MVHFRTAAAIFVVTVGLFTSYRVTTPPQNQIPYPQDYRKWTHVKSQLIGPQSVFFKSGGGIHHIYANEKAMEGYRTGKFADGAILVFDLLEAKEKEGVTTEGRRERIDVMLKNAQGFSDSGGWGFERFLGDSEKDRPLTEEHRGLCFDCHEQRKTHDFVFSEYRN